MDGDLVMDYPESRHVLIAGGIGVTPYRAMLLALDHAGESINADLLYANRDLDFPYLAELETLAERHPAFKIHYFTDSNRLDENSIRTAVGDLTKPRFYVSGPEPMVEAFDKLLLTMKIPRSRIKRDDFPGYSWP